MPQLWKTGRPTASGSSAQQGSSANPPAKGFFICPPKLVLGDGEPPTPTPSSANNTTTSNGLFGSLSSPPSSPTSPTNHQHPPKYDQLLNELRRAQERRGRLQSDVGVPGQPPLLPAAATASTASTVLLKNPPAEAMLQLRRTLRSPEPPPSGALFSRSYLLLCLMAVYYANQVNVALCSSGLLALSASQPDDSSGLV